MKKIKLVLHQPQVNKCIGRELNLMLNDKANILDAIMEVDRVIGGREHFLIEGYGSFLHMVYNPIEKRFYKQVAVTAYDQNGKIFNVRENLKRELPEGATIILIPAGGCIGDWEEAIDYKEFLKAIQTDLGGET